MRIALCDDTLTDLGQVKASLESYKLKNPEASLILNTFSNPDEFLQAYGLDPHYDLILLDMVMPFMSGLEVASTIRQSDDQVKIVFLTISPEFAIEAYGVKAYHYLIKPVQEGRLFRILDEIAVWIRERHNTSLLLRDRESMIKLSIAKIAYIEVIKHRLFYHLMDNSILSSYTSLKEVSDTLLKEAHFIKVHKSYLVNYHAVVALSNQCFIMNDKTRIPISRALYKPIRQHYIRFLSLQGQTR
jgi:DNA-binding LytR/AlgR family response regulator